MIKFIIVIGWKYFLITLHKAITELFKLTFQPLFCENNIEKKEHSKDFKTQKWFLWLKLKKNDC